MTTLVTAEKVFACQYANRLFVLSCLYYRVYIYWPMLTVSMFRSGSFFQVSSSSPLFFVGIVVNPTSIAMFDKDVKKDDDSPAATASDNSSHQAGPTAFHRRQSWFPHKDHKSFQWHIYDNNGSYNGWFDWLPRWMRVGYWSPVAVMFFLAFYASLYLYKPDPLEFQVASIAQVDNSWWAADCAVLLWGVIVVVHARMTLGSMSAFFLSYTGWSWLIMTARAGLDALAPILVAKWPNLATQVATIASSLRFPAALAAFITFTIWNLILLPLIYFVSMPPGGEKRRNFLKFNFSFFMTNIHILNLPLSMINTIYGKGVRLFTMSDLWIGYLVLALYSLLYLLVMDRLGLHFYPIFCPRSASCAFSLGLVIYLYYSLLQQGNTLIQFWNPGCCD